MLRLPDVLSAYEFRWRTLTEQLYSVKAKAVSEQIQMALMVSDTCLETHHDVGRTIERCTTWLKRQRETNPRRIGSTLRQIQDIQDRLDPARASDSDSATDAFLGALASMQRQAAGDLLKVQIRGAKLKLLTSDLLLSMATLWLELLEALYRSDSRRIFFDRLEKIFGYASSKLPVIGDILEAIKTATEVLAIRKVQAQDADKYMLSLESYIDAGFLYLCGVLAFCEHADRLLAGLPAPTDEEVQARIAAHVSRAKGTHATSVARNG